MNDHDRHPNLPKLDAKRLSLWRDVLPAAGEVQ
jgi:hypothetical protein